MTTTTFDPTSTATSLAKAYVDPAQTLLDQQTKSASATASALTKLQSALSAFDSALAGLSAKKSVVANTATFGDTAYGSATATSKAVPGSYSFFVEQLATASQAVYSGLDTVPMSETGSLGIQLAGGTSFNVDLSTADSNADGKLSPAELAAAINGSADNDSLVTASVVTVNGSSQMVLSSDATGAENAVTLDTSGLSGSLATSLSGGTTLVAAQDAVVWLGNQTTGIKLTQASNTFDAIAGVSMTFTKAMATGATPVTLTVASDSSSTVANVQSFVDAYNALESVLDSLTTAGDPANKVAAGIFSSDSGVASLRSSLQSQIRQSIGGVTLASYGITANRDGSLALDSARLKTKLAANPDGLDALLGQTGTLSGTGVLGSLDKTMNAWTNGATGQIKQRQSSLNTQQSSLTDRQTTLDNQYNSAYARYLAQFTQLANLQAQMAQTTSMFDALFNTSNN